MNNEATKSTNKGGAPTKFDPDFHPADYLEKKRVGWTDARIAASWDIDKATLCAWGHKELSQLRGRGQTLAESWLDEQFYNQLIYPNPNQSFQIYKDMRKYLIQHRKSGFSKDTLQQKMQKIDKLFEDGIYDIDQWAKARLTLNQSAIEALLVTYKEEKKKAKGEK